MSQYDIEMNESSQAFYNCWLAAAQHLTKQVDIPLRFLRSNLTPPILEHLSFIIGNQIFFICVIDVDNEVQGPTGLKHCLSAAEMGNGIACKMPMKFSSNGWEPATNGWGLLEIEVEKEVNPVELITEEKIEISDWELMDLANQIVVQKIKEEGGKIMSFNSDPNINPSIFFVNEKEEVCFVQVLTSRYPKMPDVNMDWLVQLRKGIGRDACNGFYAEVSVASEHDAFDPEEDKGYPLYRGDQYFIKFDGLEEIIYP